MRAGILFVEHLKCTHCNRYNGEKDDAQKELLIPIELLI